MKLLCTTVFTLAITTTSFADVFTVDDDGKADFDNIQAAVNAVSDGGNFIIPLDEITQDACITSHERIIANEAIADYKKKNPNRSDRFMPGVLTFFPMGGRLYQDIYTQNYVDLDSSTGILDWDCTNHSYDGHKGNDTGLRSFTEQIIGVPAFSAMDGIIVYAHDGEYDMNTECVGDGNAVIIDHGNDIYGYYWHFKNGSISVSEGDYVAAGEQIAEIASSGCSTGPHLHFELRNHDWFGGDTLEPYSGDCNPVDTMWQEQVGIERTTYIQDHGITRSHFDTWPSHPYRYPNDHQFLLGDSHQYYWFLIHNLPAKGTYTWKWYKPDGTLSYEYNGTYDNEVIYRSVTWTFYWNIGDMHQYPGTWHVELEINDETVLDMYPEIVAELDPSFNNPPAQIELSTYPEAPTVGDVLECNILGSITNDDPDRDVLRYRYLWKVNDVVVRDIVSAAMKDVLAWNILQANDVVTIEVTPNDGYIDGSTSNLEVTVAAHQTIWTVDDNGPADFADLQSAVDAANDGDEIYVYPGTYTGDGNNVVHIMGKSIFMHSSDGPENTFINGEGDRRILFCSDSILQSTIEGFTFQNGVAPTGLGYENSRGGGMLVLNGVLSIDNCIFINNTAPGESGWGGGAYVRSIDGFSSEVAFNNSAFLNNFAGKDGGGLINVNGIVEINYCLFEENMATEGGGGLALQSCEATITGSYITRNTAGVGIFGSGGGGILSYLCKPLLINTIICDNLPNQASGWFVDGGGNIIAAECPIDCPDINGDGYVNVNDILILIGYWGSTNSSADVNDDGIVDVSDLLIVVGNWGPCE